MFELNPDPKPDEFDLSNQTIEVLVNLYREMLPGSSITIYIQDDALFVDADGVSSPEGVLTITKPSVVTCLGLNLQRKTDGID